MTVEVVGRRTWAVPQQRSRTSTTRTSIASCPLPTCRGSGPGNFADGSPRPATDLSRISGSFVIARLRFHYKASLRT